VTISRRQHSPLRADLTSLIENQAVKSALNRYYTLHESFLVRMDAVRQLQNSYYEATLGVVDLGMVSIMSQGSPGPVTGEDALATRGRFLASNDGVAWLPRRPDTADDRVVARPSSRGERVGRWRTRLRTQSLIDVTARLTWRRYGESRRKSGASGLQVWLSTHRVPSFAR
jgi:hypothetical protein